MTVPARPKIYHIAHVDRLPSIIASGGLLSDAQIAGRTGTGTTIGMDRIKRRRLNELSLASHPGLFVGQCVPFYFCPRSVMLHMMSIPLAERRNTELTYDGGQEPILHLEADLRDTVAWANQNNRRWAFTLTNAGSYHFEDRSDLAQLNEIDWAVVNSRYWSQYRERKQAEFLIENNFPWHLVEKIGAFDNVWAQTALRNMGAATHRPTVEIHREWYY